MSRAMDPSNKPIHDVVDSRVNPYAPPATPLGGETARAPGGALRSPWVWCYAAGQLVAIGAYAAHAMLGAGSSAYGYVLRLACALVGLGWLGSAYERVPRRLRISYSPGAFVGRHFLPIYNLYWMFKAQNILCDGLDALLAERDLRPDAPRGLALVGCGFVIASRFFSGLHMAVFLAFSIVQASVWTLYMIGVEATFTRASHAAARQLCESCKVENDVDAMFCTTCGAPLARTSA